MICLSVSEQRVLDNYSDNFFFRDEVRNCHKMIRCDDEILAALSSEHRDVGKTQLLWGLPGS